MKRFLLSLVALVITSVCFAQDIIVQKDGNTILAKVLKVSQSEIEYKKHNNLNGPTYTISTKDLQCINYENGTKDTFVSQNYNPGIVTNETATQFSNDKQLLKLYNQDNEPLKKAKTLKGAGIIGGGVFILTGVMSLSGILGGDPGDTSSCDEIGFVLTGIGLVGGTTLYLVGNSMQKKAQNQLGVTPIYQQEFSVGKNDRMLVGIDMLKDNLYKNQTIGLGVSFNF